MRIKINKKYILSLTFFILVSLSLKVFAYDTGTFPEIDGWKNGDTYVGGSAVEYNGLRIGNTVWCKPGDVLGVTAWGKQYSKKSWDNCIAHTYMSFGGADVFNKYLDVHYSDKSLDNYYTEYAARDIALVGSENGETSTNAQMQDYLRIGTIFWCQFKENNKTYSIRTNEYSRNGNWLYPEAKTPEQDSPYRWAYSIENIRTDGDAPSVSISPKTQWWTNKPIKIVFNIDDKGCGIQKYRYSICKNGIWQDYDWIYVETHSTLDNSSFIRLYPTSAGENHRIESLEDTPKQIPNSENNLNNTITLSDQGIYQVKVQAVDNLGNTSDWQTSQNYYIDTTPPTGIYTPKSISNDSATLNFKPYDEGGSGVLLWRYRLSKDNGTTWGDWSNTIDGDAAKDISLEDSGKYKIQSEVTDRAGNVSDIYSETYNLEDSITVKASVAPNPGKQGQQITFDINTTGNAKYITIYMPVEITSVDTSGTIFPINKTIKEEQTHNEKIQYVIPLKAPQSIRKNEGRIREPYKVIIIAKKQDGKTAKTSVDLDISGNVLDGIKTEIIGTGYDKGK